MAQGCCEDLSRSRELGFEGSDGPGGVTEVPRAIDPQRSDLLDVVSQFGLPVEQRDTAEPIVL